MRRPIRRRAAPYKSPRLFSMVALLVCLLLMMNTLRSMRGPGPLTQRILSNLDDSLKQVGPSTRELPGKKQTELVSTERQPQETATTAATAEAPLVTEQSQPTASDEQRTAETEQENQSEVKNTETNTASNSTESVSGEESLPGESNVSDLPNLNLREDLELQDWLGLVQDGSLKMQKLEMPAYWRMMSVVKKTPFNDLLKAADSKVRFNDLYSSAANQRSKLLTLTVNVRKITRYDTEENPAEVQELYEVWGWSETSKAWLYVFVTPELPPGLDANTPVNQTAKFAGYFFKLQGYQPGAAKPNAKPLLAPMLIGKFELTKPTQRVAVQPFATLEWIIGAITLAVGVALIFLRIFVFKTKKPKLSHVPSNTKFDFFPPHSDAQDQN